MNRTARAYGLIAEFDTPAGLLHAAWRVREAGFKRWDAFAPFPVRGLDQALGIKNSTVGWFAFIGSSAGCAAGMLIVWFMNAFNYPVPVGGKPMFSLIPAIPTSFELAVLLGAAGALCGMLWLDRLPRLHHPLLKHKGFARASQDRFYILIECADPKYSEIETRNLLTEAGSKRLELVEE
jgi:hypothetical protein